MTRSETGKLGEEKVCEYLSERGYTIEARNYRIKGGEIDIIASDGDVIAFIEVKTRKPGSLVTGFEAVNKRKIGLMIKTAADYCCRHDSVLQPRFDMAQVVIDGDKVLSIDHITNAFDTTGYNFIF